MYCRSRYTNALIESLLNTGYVIVISNGFHAQPQGRFGEIADIIDLAGEAVLTVMNELGESEGSISLSLKHRGEKQIINSIGTLPGVIVTKLIYRMQFGNLMSAEFAGV